jgi:hypothetical protein
MHHRIYYSPCIFGFGKLAHYDYFAHVERALEARLRDAGHQVSSHVVDVLPTASLRRRAALLARFVKETAGDDDGPIHLLGHSTGGLDARLVASSTASLALAPGALDWQPRLRSVTMMNTPHFGTPLAKFFATVNGQRVLFLISALTFIGLSVGATPLAAASSMVGLFGRLEQASHLGPAALGRSVHSLLRLLDDAGSPEVRGFLAAIQQDQGAVLQLTPEAMDLFQAGVEDRAGVLYQSTASMSPLASPRKWLTLAAHPLTAASMSIFTALHTVTAQEDRRYPCGAVLAAAPGAPASPFAGAQTEAMLAARLPGPIDLRANDGVVPLRSQLWGTLAWAGLGDHLDVLGHFRDARPSDGGGLALRHRDWLTSGSAFGLAQFGALADAIAKGMLAAV